MNTIYKYVMAISVYLIVLFAPNNSGSKPLFSTHSNEERTEKISTRSYVWDRLVTEFNNDQLKQDAGQILFFPEKIAPQIPFTL